MNQFLAVDARTEVRIIKQYAVHAQDVRDQVVGEDGQLAKIVETPQSVTVEGERKVGGGDLRALVERDAIPAILRDVVEEGHRAEQPDQLLRGISGALDQRSKTSAIRVDQQAPEVVQGGRESLHQFASD